jgi:uncharacterized membrane protein YphA (DoxX/SURF4 family)
MSTPLRQPRRVFLYVAVVLALVMVVLLALGYLVPAVAVGVLAVGSVFAGARPTGGA